MRPLTIIMITINSRVIGSALTIGSSQLVNRNTPKIELVLMLLTNSFFTSPYQPSILEVKRTRVALNTDDVR